MSAESPASTENPEELTKEVSNMFNEKRLEELKKTFQLYKSSPKAIEIISKCFRLYIIKRFYNIIKKPRYVQRSYKLIPQLINLKKEMDNLTEECFGNDKIFKDTNHLPFVNICLLIFI